MQAKNFHRAALAFDKPVGSFERRSNLSGYPAVAQARFTSNLKLRIVLNFELSWLWEVRPGASHETP